MYGGSESHKDTLHVSPHIAAHRSSSPGSLSAHIPTYKMGGAENIPLYRIGAQSVLNLKSSDVQTSQGVACSSGNSINHILKNGPRDLTAYSTSVLSEKSSTSVDALTSSSVQYQKSSPHIHTVVSQGIPNTQMLPTHTTERTSHYRAPDSVIGIQSPSAILVPSNVNSHLLNTQSSQTANIGNNVTSQNLGNTSTTDALSTPLPAHLSSSSSVSYSSSNGNITQIPAGTIFKLQKNPQHIEPLTTMASNGSQMIQQDEQIQHGQQHNQQSQSYSQESHQPQRHEQEQGQQHSNQTYQQQSNQQQQITQQQSVHNQQQSQQQPQQQPQQQLVSSVPQQRTDLVQQALTRAVSSNPNQTGSGNDKEVLEYSYTAGDIAELLMMNIQGNPLLQNSKKQPGTTTTIVTPITGVATGPISDINNESQVLLLQPAAIDETNSLQPQSKQKQKLPAEDQQDKRVKIAERMRNKRADENEEAKALRRLREAERMRRKRASEDEETKEKRRKEAAIRARHRRATMSDEERIIDRQRAAERMRLRRKTEDEHQKAIRRMKAAERMRARRAMETPEQRASRRARMSEKMNLVKAKRKVKPEANNEDSSTDSVTKPIFSQTNSEIRGETLVELPEVTIERSSLQRAQLERTQQILRSQDIERPQIQRVIHLHNENQNFNSNLKNNIQQHKFDVPSKCKIESVKIENANESRIILPTNLAQSSGLSYVDIKDIPTISTISTTLTTSTLSTVDLSQLSGQSLSLNNKTLISNKEVLQLSESQRGLNKKVLPTNQELQMQIVQPLSLSTKSLSAQGIPQVSGQTISTISGNGKSFSTHQEVSNLSEHQMQVNSKTLSQGTVQILSQSVTRQTLNVKPLSVNQPLSQLDQPKSLNSKSLSSVQEITQICGQTIAGNLKSFTSNSDILQFGQPLIINAKSLSSIQGIAQVTGQPFIIAKNVSSNQEHVQSEQPVLINAKPLLSNQSLGQPLSFMAKNTSNNQESTSWIPLSRNYKNFEKLLASANNTANDTESHSSQPLPLTARISSKYDTSHGEPLSFNVKKNTAALSETKQEVTEPLALQKYQQVQQTESKSSSTPSNSSSLTTSVTSIANMASTNAPIELSHVKHNHSSLSGNVIVAGGKSITTTAPSTSAPLELSNAKQQQSTAANNHPSFVNNNPPSSNHSQQQNLTRVNFQQQPSSSQLQVQQTHQET